MSWLVTKWAFGSSGKSPSATVLADTRLELSWRSIKISLIDLMPGAQPSGNDMTNTPGVQESIRELGCAQAAPQITSASCDCGLHLSLTSSALDSTLRMEQNRLPSAGMNCLPSTKAG